MSNVETSKIQSKGIKSVRSRVTNIRVRLDKDISIPEFVDLITRDVFKFQGEHFEEYMFLPEDQQNISRFMEEKYTTWDWNYGQSPPFNFKNSKRFVCGKVEVLLEVKNGLISGCKIYSDLLGCGLPPMIYEGCWTI